MDAEIDKMGSSLRLRGCEMSPGTVRVAPVARIHGRFAMRIELHLIYWYLQKSGTVNG